jgi:hypothetical protein
VGVSGERFSAGQHVDVEIGGRRIQCVFVRYAAPQPGVNVKGAESSAGESAAEIGWVRRSDTGEVEPVELRLICAV